MSEASLSTGVTLRFAAQGDPAGVPLVLLHGYTDSHPSYAPMMAHLPETIRAYALTARAATAIRTSPSTATRSPTEQVGHALHWEEPERAAADVAAFLSPRGPRRPRLAGVR